MLQAKEIDRWMDQNEQHIHRVRSRVVAEIQKSLPAFRKALSSEQYKKLIEGLRKPEGVQDWQAWFKECGMNWAIAPVLWVRYIEMMKKDNAV